MKSALNPTSRMILWLTFLLIQATIYGQQWEHHFGISNYDHISDLAITSDSLIVAANGYYDNSSATAGFGVVAFEADGTPAWDRRWIAGLYDQITGVSVTKSNKVMMSGTVVRSGYRGFLFCLGTNRDTLWTSTTNVGPRFYDMTQKDGEVVCGGLILSSGSSGITPCLAQFDTMGNLLSSRNFEITAASDGISRSAQLTAITHSANGDISGVGQLTNDLHKYLLFFRDDGDSTLDKLLILGRASADVEATGIVPCKDGGHLILGKTRTGTTGEYDILLLKLDSLDNVDWHKVYGGFSSDMAIEGVELASGDYMIAGKYGYGSNDNGLLFHLDHSGNRLGSTTFGGLNINSFSTLIPYKESGFVMGGSVSKSLVGNFAYILRVDSLGKSDCSHSNVVLAEDFCTLTPFLVDHTVEHLPLDRNYCPYVVDSGLTTLLGCPVGIDDAVEPEPIAWLTITASQELQMNAQANIASVVVVDGMGRTVKTMKVDGASTSIQMGELPSGVLFFRVALWDGSTAMVKGLSWH
jgi:hypothetical protein